MMPDILLFCIALLSTGALLFLLVYFVSSQNPDKITHPYFSILYPFSYLSIFHTCKVITLSDVECDYLNAQQCCANLNFWVLPKVGTHTTLTILLLCTGHWYLLFTNAPVVVWQIRELCRLPTGNMGIYDPTEIHNRGMVKKHLKDCMIYLGFYLVMFFIYVYW